MILAIGASGRASTIIHVDADAAPDGDGSSWSTAYDSLSAALSTAQPGDQIWVAAGTYVGNFTLAPEVKLYGGFAGDETDLGHRAWKANPTILDGNQSGSVITVSGGATASTRIDGFTITNGSGTPSGGFSYGGGLYVMNASPTIANNNITGNTVTSDGGGLYLRDSSSTIEDNTISGNRANFAGGALFAQLSWPTIANNTVVGNRASYYGGGLCVVQSFPTIVHNSIIGNTSRGWDGLGGGLCLWDSASLIATNFFSGNSAEGDGGGIYLFDSSSIIVSNTITSNTAGRYGGGAAFVGDSSQSTGNTITGNGAQQGGGLYLEESSAKTANSIVAFNSSGIYQAGGAPTLRYNCVYGNHEYDYDGLADPTGIDGNISEDPLLADATYGNVHIQPGSPCVDSGSNADAWGDSDVDGDPRVAGGGPDIGSDESDGTAWPAGPYTIVRVSPTGDDANDGSSWASAKRTVQAGIDSAVAPGGDVWVRAGTYEELVTLYPHAHVYGGFSGIETDRAQRDWEVNVTTLDGQGAGTVVTVGAGFGVSALDGFTITNGVGSDGGGLHVEFCAPTISNNTITNNDASDGGGIYLGYASPRIENSRITGNRAYAGGGLYMEYSSPVVANVTIAHNIAANGGGAYLAHSDPTITNSAITRNRAEGQGGGLSMGSGSETVANSTITENIASGGGGISLGTSPSTIANTIVAFNSSGISGRVGSVVLRHNCVYGNTEYDYDGLADPTGTEGNISADPLLGNANYGNLHIQPGSPCVDAGSNIDAWGDHDVDGDPRILGDAVDIGFDESNGTVWSQGPYAIVRVSPGGDDVNDGSSWASAKRTVQAGIDTASALGGEVWVQAGTYEERLTLHPYAYVFGGFSGLETERGQRDFDNNVTTIDGQQAGSVVTVREGFGISTIDGFTMTHGSAEFGGGIHVTYSAPTITNNTISGNGADLGGGLYVSHASPTISRNTISGNSARYNGGGVFLELSFSEIVNNTITNNTAFQGGGLDLEASSATIEDNTIENNSAKYGGGLSLYQSSASITNNAFGGNTAREGGGLYLAHSSSAMIAGNSIVGNKAHWNGGGLSLHWASPTIANNTIAGNAAAYNGGGLRISNSYPALANNTITGNVAEDGGGLCLSEADATIANSIVVFNSSGIFQTDDDSSMLRHNCVYGNTEYDYTGGADPTGMDGNISAPPFFVQDPGPGPDAEWGTDDDEPGDLRLLSGSPCVDAGDNDAVPSDAADLDNDDDIAEPLPFDFAGAPRFIDAPYTPDTGSGTPPIVDIGAYEYQPGNCDAVGLVTLADLGDLPICLSGGDSVVPATCDCLDMDADGDVDLADYAAIQLAFSGW